jgi:hypothetical protein
MGAIGVVAQCGANARDFVACNTCANTRATNENASFGFLRAHSVANKPGNVGKVNGFGAVCAEVCDIVAAFYKQVYHRPFEGKSGMITTNGEFHR